MSVSLFSPIVKNNLIPLEENCSSLRFTTQFFNFGQKAYTITKIDKTMTEVKENTEKPSWLMTIVRIIAIATVIIPITMFLLLCIYRLANSFKVEFELKNGGDCSICDDPISEYDAVLLQCKHAYHTHCLDEWKSKNPICPLDRKPIVIESQLPAQK